MTVTHGPGSPEPHPSQGPYDSEDQARTEPAVRAVYAAMRRTAPGGAMRDGSEAIILGACDRAGVALGNYDARIVRWLSGFEPQACAVVAGLIARAHAAGAAGHQGDEAGRCVQCGGPITPYSDPYNGAPRWRHVPRADPVAEFLDAEHGAEPAEGDAR